MAVTERDAILTQFVSDAGGAEYWFHEGCYITEIWNNASDISVSIARARVVAGNCTRWHQLTGITERYLLVSGQGHVQLGDGASGTLRAGDAVVIPPGIAQRVVNTGVGDLIFLAVCTPRFRPAAYQDVDGNATHPPYRQSN